MLKGLRQKKGVIWRGNSAFWMGSPAPTWRGVGASFVGGKGQRSSSGGGGASMEAFCALHFPLENECSL